MSCSFRCIFALSVHVLDHRLPTHLHICRAYTTYLTITHRTYHIDRSLTFLFSFDIFTLSAVRTRPPYVRLPFSSAEPNGKKSQTVTYACARASAIRISMIVDAAAALHQSNRCCIDQLSSAFGNVSRGNFMHTFCSMCGVCVDRVMAARANKQSVAR